MSKVIFVPHRLQQGMTFDDSMPFINDNFENVADSFSGFAVENELAFPSNLGNLTLGSGQGAIFIVGVYTPDPQSAVIITYPRISWYVDDPTDLSTNPTSLNSDYLFPTGSQITSERAGFLFTGYVGLTPAINNVGDSFISNTDGQTYYYTRDVIYVARNAGTVTHKYYLVWGQSVYSTGVSFYQ